MRYFVPTNWQPDLLESLAPWASDITLYGKSALEDAVGGGRPGFVLPDPAQDQIAAHIARARTLGFRFSYLMNATCLGNLEMTRSGQDQIAALLDKVVGWGAQEITVSTQVLLQLIKKRHPEIGVSVGFFAQINSVQKAVFWEEIGADRIILYPDLNRDFARLKAVRRAVKVPLQVIATLVCLYNCSNIANCGNVISHGSTGCGSDPGHAHGEKVFPMEHPIFNCQMMEMKRPGLIMRSRWIRPEDLHLIEELGIDEVKITERFNKTETLLTKFHAYRTRSYDGNLFDLFASHIYNREMSLAPEKTNIIRRLKESALKISALPDYKKAPHLHLDNKKLDGFIDFFKTHDCTKVNCEDCRYCDRFGEPLIEERGGTRAEMVREFAIFHEEFLTGKIFGG